MAVFISIFYKPAAEKSEGAAWAKPVSGDTSSALWPRGRGACGIVAAIMSQRLSEMQICFGCHLVKVAEQLIMCAVIIQEEP